MTAAASAVTPASHYSPGRVGPSASTWPPPTVWSRCTAGTT